MACEPPRDWLLIRGLGREAAHWGPFPEALVAALPAGSRVHALDNPGVGSERAAKAPLTLRATSADLLRRWEALRAAQGMTEPWGVVGISMGGMLALDMAALDMAAGADAARAGGEAARSGLAAVCVVNSSGAKGTTLRQRLTPRAAGAMLRCLLLPRHAREAAMLRVTVRDEACVAQLLPSFQALAEARPLPFRTFMAQLAACSRWRAPTAVSVPVLFVNSLGDELCAPDCSVALAQSLRAPLRSHPSAGHDLPAEDPAWLASTVRAWVDAGTPRHADW